MKTVKFIQVNVFLGTYLGALIDFLRAEEPDIISMQEVSTGALCKSAPPIDDVFGALQEALGYDGVRHADIQLNNDSGSTSGNAILTHLPIVDSQVVTLKTFRPLSLEETMKNPALIQQLPRHALDVQVKVGTKTLRALSWHGAWVAPPQDTPELLRQAQILSTYIKSLKAPFVMGCDANAVVQSKTIQAVGNGIRNCMLGSGILQSTHPKLHAIVPRGFLVDYIFSSPELNLIDIKAPLVNVSDHLPIVSRFKL